MSFSKMKTFPEHPFQLYTGKRLDEMVESIKANGIYEPILLWLKCDGTYTILSGHNRVKAAKIVGLTESPVRIRENITDEEAMIAVIETNMNQRGFLEMSYSERAISLKNHYDAIKCQGRRADLINEIESLLKPHDDVAQDACVQVEHMKSRDKLANENGLSATNVTRYIRIATYLSSHLLAYVDTGNISFLAAYDISFIENKDLQTIISNIIKRDDCKIDMKMAALLRGYYIKGTLTESLIEQILSGEKTRKPKSDKPKPFSLKSAIVKKHFTKKEYTLAEMENIIDQALSEYFIKESSAQS
jgi:ParB family chromosome partitioning protein